MDGCRGTKDQVPCAWRALNSSHITFHHSGYLEASMQDVGVGIVVVIWKGFGLKIPDFARFCMTWVLQGVGALVVKISIAFPVSTIDETCKDWQVALVSIKGEQVLSTVGELEAGDCGRFSKVSNRLGPEMDWVWDGEEGGDWAKKKIVSWKIIFRETMVCLDDRL